MPGRPAEPLTVASFVWNTKLVFDNTAKYWMILTFIVQKDKTAVCPQQEFYVQMVVGMVKAWDLCLLLYFRPWSPEICIKKQKLNIRLGTATNPLKENPS